MGEPARGDGKEVGTQVSQERILPDELLLPHEPLITAIGIIKSN